MITPPPISFFSSSASVTTNSVVSDASQTVDGAPTRDQSAVCHSPFPWSQSATAVWERPDILQAAADEQESSEGSSPSEEGSSPYQRWNDEECLRVKDLPLFDYHEIEQSRSSGSCSLVIEGRGLVSKIAAFRGRISQVDVRQARAASRRQIAAETPPPKSRSDSAIPRLMRSCCYYREKEKEESQRREEIRQHELRCARHAPTSKLPPFLSGQALASSPVQKKVAE